MRGRGHAAGGLEALGAGPGPLARGLGMAEAVFERTVAVGRLPIELLRGLTGEEELLRSARELCASAALEVATYRALSQVAQETGDEETAALARVIRSEQEALLRDVLEIIDELVTEVIDAEVRDHGAYEAAVGGVTGASLVSAADLPIAGYDELPAHEVVERLAALSQADLARLDGYERRRRGRMGILSRIESLRTSEPWPGYDALSVAGVQERLAGLEAGRLAEVRAYERRHKNRRGVIAACGGDLIAAS